MTRYLGAVFALLAGTIGLAACGSECTENCGGAGAGGTAGASGLQVAETNPPDLASDVALDTSVLATFNETLNKSTVTSASFFVHRADESELAGVVEVTADGTTVIFTPQEPFSLGTSYTAVLTTEIQSITSHQLEADYDWTFTSRDGDWGTARRMQSNQTGNSFAPRVTMNAGGDSIAVWQDGMYGGPIWASRYTQDAGWTAGVRINIDVVGNGFAPQIDIAPSGDAVAVWAQASGIWANQYSVSGDWGDPVRIDDDQGGGSPQVAVDASGDAVAVWLQPGGRVWSNRFNPNGGWATAQRIESDDAGTARVPRVAVDAAGNAVAVWERWDGMSSFNIWANQFTPSGGWLAASRINSAEATGAHDPDVTMDPSGDAIAVWWQADSERRGIWSNHFTPSGGWRQDEKISSDSAEEANAPQVEVDPNGRALVVWQQAGGIWSSRHTSEGEWGPDRRIDDEALGMAIAPALSVDPNGNAMAVWQQDDGDGFGVWACRFASEDWAAPELIDAEDGGGTGGPQVASDAQGHANAVWLQSNGEGTQIDVWSNRFE